MNVIVNEIHQGLIFKDDVFQDLQPGDRLKGWVKKTRPDGKIDITMQRPGYRSIEPNAQDILNEMELKGGFLPLTDKSSPDEIQKKLQMSKKSFKRPLVLYTNNEKLKLKKTGFILRKMKINNSRIPDCNTGFS